MKFKIIEMSGYPRLVQTLMGLAANINNFGIMTAENPGVKVTSAENKEFNSKLRSILKQNFPGFYQIRGQWEGIKEKPFFIPNISREDLINLAREFNQDAAIHGAADDEGMKFSYIDASSGETQDEKYIFQALHKNVDDNYSEYKGRKFMIPFFNDLLVSAKFNHDTNRGVGIE